jgi:RNA polymerase sigma factor (sigma-70 family)
LDGSLRLPSLKYRVVVLDRGHIFEQNRRRLHNLAHRLLGSVADADDVTQDVYIRWHQTAALELHSPDAWLTTVLTRLCIDRLRARGRERDTYPGHWLPEPLVIAPPDRGLDLDADLSMALLFLLERLSPDERITFLLHDVFGHRHREIEAECRRRGIARLVLGTAAIQKAAVALYRGGGYRLIRDDVAEMASNKTVGSGLRRFHFEKIL